MTATDVLRRLLDERWVEWKAWDGTHPITVWHDETYLYEFIEYRLVNGAKQVSNCPSDNDGHCELTIKVFNCTPEQAIAATLGSCNCSNNCTNSGRTETCHPVISDNLTESEGTGDAWADCSECGHLLFVLTDPNSEPPNYCPNCGAKVVEPTTNDVGAEVDA